MLTKEVIEHVNNALAITGYSHIRPQIFIRWSNALKSTAGKCSVRGFKNNITYTLIFSVRIFSVRTTEENITTVYHEVCHAIAEHLYNTDRQKYIDYTPHGRLWQSLMIKCGKVPNRTFSHPLVKTKHRPKKRVYCKCAGERLIGDIQYKRISRGQTVYRCRACNSMISLTPS